MILQKPQGTTTQSLKPADAGGPISRGKGRMPPGVDLGQAVRQFQPGVSPQDAMSRAGGMPQHAAWAQNRGLPPMVPQQGQMNDAMSRANALRNMQNTQDMGQEIDAGISQPGVDMTMPAGGWGQNFENDPRRGMPVTRSAGMAPANGVGQFDPNQQGHAQDPWAAFANGTGPRPRGMVPPSAQALFNGSMPAQAIRRSVMPTRRGPGVV